MNIKSWNNLMTVHKTNYQFINKITDKKIEEKIFNDLCKIFINNHPTGDYILDKKRQVSKKEKIQIWNESKFHSKFDPEYFRLDMFGLVCIKNNDKSYYLNKNNKIFNYEYEHILSHCNGGKSTTDNVALLNKNINRFKG